MIELSEHKINIIKSINENIFNNLFNDVIFIYTPPKVGSTTLVSSIRICASHKYSVVHLHDEIMLRVMVGLNEDISINEIIYYNKMIGKNIYVIDVYRTPIERKMSEYFEKLSCYHFNNSEENLNNYNINLIIKRFNSIFPFIGIGDHYYEKYNIKPDNFDFDKNYIFQNVEGINYIKLRLNDSNNWGNILSSILKTDIIIIPDYETNNKKIGNLYDNFKANYKLPLNYYELIKNDKYFNIYMNEKERNSYLNKWNNKLTNNFDSYTKEQYDFYINLCMENQYYIDFQLQHYFDNGCICKLCAKKRNEIYNKVKSGQKINEKIIHFDIANKDKLNKIETLKNIANKINKKNNKKISELSDFTNINTNLNNKNNKKLRSINFH